MIPRAHLALGLLTLLTSCQAVPAARAAHDLRCSGEVTTARVNPRVYRAQGCGRVLYYSAQCSQAPCTFTSELSLLEDAGKQLLQCHDPIRAESRPDQAIFVSGCGKSLQLYRTISDQGVTFSASLTRPNIPSSRQLIVDRDQPLSPEEIFNLSLRSIVVVTTPQGQGTGFVAGPGGLVVTSLHVVRGESDIKVQGMDGQLWPVLRVEGYSEATDLAVLRTQSNAPYLPIFPHQDVGRGSSVVAIGHPLGLRATLSAGIVSGLRSKDGVDIIQITAPISPGSSGGPIINQYGEVVGIATFILREGAGLGFAIPAHYLRDIATALDPMPLQKFASQTYRKDKLPSDAKLAASVLNECPKDELASILTKVQAADEASEPLRENENYTAAFYVLQGALDEIAQTHGSKCAELGTLLARKKTQANSLDSFLEKLVVLSVALESVQRDIEERNHQTAHPDTSSKD